jgi:8-oxo-dGTP pyrophosphatase MutT (NUDIX family)
MTGPLPKTAFPIPIVRLIVTDAEGRVLILRRQSTGHALGQWCLPGGKVDYGATVEQAVRAELKEETSLDCLEAEFLFYQDSLPPEPGAMHCINFYFRCRTAGTLALNRESSEYAWIRPMELATYALVFRNDEALERFWQS